MRKKPRRESNSITFSVRCDSELMEEFKSSAKSIGKNTNQAIVELMELFALHDDEKYLKWKAKAANREFQACKKQLDDFRNWKKEKAHTEAYDK